MGLNFPTAPTVGQLYPDPATIGVPQYIWNGTTWTVESVPAVPFDALAYNGIQINGSMDISQERGTTAFALPAGGLGGWIVDNWQVYSVGAATSAQQVADAPPGFASSIKYTVTTAKGSLAATDQTQIFHQIEGYRTSRLRFGTASALPVSIGFWVKIHRTGTYSGALGNSGLSRCYPFTFTQSVADTWEYKTVTIPGDTTGTWVGNTNGVGFVLQFAMGVGSGLAQPANAWIGSAAVGATGSTNGVAALTDTFQITGVVVLPGSTAPTAAQSPLIMCPYDQEWVTCQRYYQQVCDGVGVAFASTAIQASVAHILQMRAAPTATASAPISITNAYTGNFTQSAGSVVINNNNTQGGLYNIANFTGLTAGTFYALNNEDGKINLDARL